MLRVSNLSVPLCGDAVGRALALACRRLRLAAGEVSSYRIARRSIDARDKGDIRLLFTLDLSVRGDEEALLWRLPSGAAVPTPAPVPLRPSAAAPRAPRPVVVGLGPCGLFAALYLARAGLRPLCLERGQSVSERAQAVQTFWRDGMLREDSNVQFGEGGAGAFSDGKLTTGIKDARCRQVLETLHAHGAPEDILYQAHPHIGTDRLPGVVASLRAEILRLGGEVRFGACLTGLICADGVLRALRLRQAGEESELPARQLILAVGHSARDTLRALLRDGVPMQQKPFSVGVRIEHRQSLIDRAQYGEAAGHPALGAAEYRLSCRLPDGRGAYTFCMCPGGQVIAAASEAGGVCTNGMSAYARDGENANAALLVDVRTEDFPSAHPLAGLDLQRAWEHAAFAAGGGAYRAPAQRVEDFLRARPSRGFGEVAPSYRPGVTPADLSPLLPDFAAAGLRFAIPFFARRLRGFDCADAVLTGPETRSSSPVRIPRDETLQSAVRGLYPAGEGAGYAGGIMSAAVDGLRAAEALAAQPPLA